MRILRAEAHIGNGPDWLKQFQLHRLPCNDRIALGTLQLAQEVLDEPAEDRLGRLESIGHGTRQQEKSADGQNDRHLNYGKGTRKPAFPAHHAALSFIPLLEREPGRKPRRLRA